MGCDSSWMDGPEPPRTDEYRNSRQGTNKKVPLVPLDELDQRILELNNKIAREKRRRIKLLEAELQRLEKEN